MDKVKLLPCLNGMTFRELSKLREEFLRDATILFDKLVSGENEVSEELWIRCQTIGTWPRRPATPPPSMPR